MRSFMEKYEGLLKAARIPAIPAPQAEALQAEEVGCESQ